MSLHSLWNYNSHNDDLTGDDWNGENFSWFSRKRALPTSLLYYEQNAVSLDQGGRILSSVVRPYPAKTAGIPLRFEYEATTGSFIYEWANPEPASTEKSAISSSPTTVHPPLNAHRAITTRETEIFLPSLITLGRDVMVHGLAANDSYLYDEGRQTLFVVVRDDTPGKKHSIRVELDPPLEPAFQVNSFWGDFGGQIISVTVLFLAIFAYWIRFVYNRQS